MVIGLSILGTFLDRGDDESSIFQLKNWNQLVHQFSSWPHSAVALQNLDVHQLPDASDDVGGS